MEEKKVNVPVRNPAGVMKLRADAKAGMLHGKRRKACALPF
ncbi:hypothetical protein M3A49_38925 [Paraburkholderia sp. CNPSo 3076]|nr:hypothetical protein [Paraburkholderia sp. CNPSo 3076]MCX5545342.1 hypothetical protein [Paraburkholderia sp. CNPSo 3076]